MESVNDLIAIFSKYLTAFEESKNILKDNTHKSITSLMKIYDDLVFKILVREKYSDEKMNEFLDQYFSLWTYDNSKEMEMCDEKKVKEEYAYLQMNYLEICFTFNHEPNLIEKFLAIYLSYFDIPKVFLNSKLFRKHFKLFLHHMSPSRVKEYLLSSIPPGDKRKLFLFHFSTCNPATCSPTDMDIIYEVTPIIQRVLPNLNDCEVSSIRMRMYYLFNKNFFFCKILNNEISLETTKNFLTKVLEIREEEYEKFIYILNDQIVTQDIGSDHCKLQILLTIIRSNQSTLHKLSVNALEKIFEMKIIRQEFLRKFISIFDVLDGYNSHLFKSLYKELEYVINECEVSFSHSQMVYVKEWDIYIKDTKSFEDIFAIPINFFLLLARKISKHDNIRIQKFFVKSFCKMKLSNHLFVAFIYSQLLHMLNNPLFYPENDSISYHAKIGRAVEDFFFNWLKTKYSSSSIEEFSENLNNYLQGIAEIITHRRIYVYLFTSIKRLMNIVENKPVIIRLNLTAINFIIDTHMKMLSVYNKSQCWESICLMLIKSDTTTIEREGILKIVYNLMKYAVFVDMENYLSVEGQNMLDPFLSQRLFHVCIEQLLVDIQLEMSIYDDDIVDLTKTERKFMLDNKLTSMPAEFPMIIMWALNNKAQTENGHLEMLLIENISKLVSPYLPDEYKLNILNHLSVFLKLLLHYQCDAIARVKILKFINCQSMDILFDNLLSIFTKFLTLISTPLSGEIPKEYMFIFRHFDSFEACFNQYLAISLQNSTETNKQNILIKCLSSFQNINDALNAISFEITQIQTDTIINLQFIKYSLHFIKMIFFHMSLCFHYGHRKFLLEFYHNETQNLAMINHTIHQCFKFLSYVESLLKQRDSNSLSQIIDYSIKIKSLGSILLNEFQPTEMLPFDEIQIRDMLSFFEMSHENGIFYCYKFFDLYLNTVIDIHLDLYQAFITNGIRTLIEKRENLNYLNTSTFLHGIINRKFLQIKEFKSEIKKCFKLFIDLNEKRTWLILKNATEALFAVLNEDPLLIIGLEDVLIDLAECKETRGEDSYMLKTSPCYLYSPFNVPCKRLLVEEFCNEDASKYGLYIRLTVLGFLENLIQKAQSIEEVECLLRLTASTLEIIDKHSSRKPEMQFTEKHRKKLRLAQLLTVLSSTFSLNQNLANSDSLLDTIEATAKSVFEKNNLSSVRFYFDVFCINFASIRNSFRRFLINCLSDPMSKTHVVSSSLIILSTFLLEKNKINPQIKEITEIIDVITTLCTSNVCNIRGFAQFFINLFSQEQSFAEQTSIGISSHFVNYLRNNSNIQRFFTKYNETFIKFTNLIRNCTVDNILKSNFDEVNCEIIPIDIVNDFKSLAIKMVSLDIEDYSKPSSSWKLNFDENENAKENEPMCLDFQKKYRPVDENIMKNKKRKRLDVVVIASLIDKAPNLGGLARTCEVLNIGSMTIGSETVLNDNGFLAAASSAERWLPLVNLPVNEIEKFIKGYKSLGYLIIGLEQTANSIPLKKFVFKEKCVIILGNEKEGIPQNIISMIDVCIVIPQFGEIRSLNVHVSAAIMLWELVNSCMQ